MVDRPGTVSKILWHFTGGPTWNAAENRQNKTPKPADAAYTAFLGILRSHVLRVGQYQEVIRVRVPEVKLFNPKTKKLAVKKNVLADLNSASVCCLADIPVVHLSYQAKRYGKFAIGFHRQSAIKSAFNPVLYTLHDTDIIRSIYEGFGRLEYLNTDEMRAAASQIEDFADYNDEVLSAASGLEMAIEDVDAAVGEARESIAQALAFIKTFDTSEFGTIYCEREWRSTQAFKFEYSDVAMLVVPRQIAGRAYFSEFASREVKRLKIPRSIPIVPWEDLVES